MHADRQHRLLRFLAINGAGGAALGLLCAGLLIWTDVGGMGGLLARAQAPVIPALLLLGGFAVTFAAVVMGAAIIMMPRSGPGRRLGDRDSVWRDDDQ